MDFKFPHKYPRGIGSYGGVYTYFGDGAAAADAAAGGAVGSVGGALTEDRAAFGAGAFAGGAGQISSPATLA